MASKRLDPAGTNLSRVIGQNVQRKYKTKGKRCISLQETRLEVERDGEQHHAGRHARVSPEEERLLAGGLDHHALQKVRAQYRPSATRGSPKKAGETGCVGS